MFNRFKQLSTLEKVKKVAVPTFFTYVVVVAYQGAKLRGEYNRSPKLSAPSGPTAGLEKWADKVRHAKDDLIESLKNDDSRVLKSINELNSKISSEIEDINRKIREKIEKIEEKIEEKLSAHSTNDNPCNENSGVFEKGVPYVDKEKKKRIKLLMLGDSLVAGVGSDDPQGSPMLPKMIAKVLSQRYKADVEWFSSGVVGGTVVDLREKVLPKIKQAIHADNFIYLETEQGPVLVKRDENIEYVVVIICGLNDWKDFFLNFPTGLWPSKFRRQLNTLVKEVETASNEAGSKCRVFLPNLPLVCFKGDPKYIMGTKPLVYFVDFICYIYDSQKEHVAEADPLTNYIGNPDPEALYATPGLGNLSSDGVHPSTKGYQWWAHHIAEQIELTDPEHSKPDNLPHYESISSSTNTADSKEKTESEGSG
eukprot:gene27913-31531_t